MSKPRKPKMVKIEIPEKPYLYMSGRLVEELDDQQFFDWAGGYLAESLFKGELRSALSSVIDIAKVRARKQYHEQLIEDAQRKK